MKPIPYGRQWISDDDIQAVVEVLRSDWLTQGPKVREFEQALCDLTGARHCVAVSNGTAALHLACLALGVGPGDTGITSPISFMASANCIAYCGGTPDFADIDPYTLCLSPVEVEKKCEQGPIPKVVIPVDFAGVPADLPAFRKLADKHGFFLIEDAAHAIGSTYTWEGETYACGSCAHTDLATFSFHPVKTITTGEGGAVLTNSDELAQKVRRLANHGIERDPERFANREIAWGGRNGNAELKSEANSWYHEMCELGFNARLTDIQCALGLCQLERLGYFKSRRQEIFHQYIEALADLEAGGRVIVPAWPEGTDPCFHLFPLRLAARGSADRDGFLRTLRKSNILCQVHYIPIYRQPFYVNSYGYGPKEFPEAEDYFWKCLSLPLYPAMESTDLQRVCGQVRMLLEPSEF